MIHCNWKAAKFLLAVTGLSLALSPPAHAQRGPAPVAVSEVIQGQVDAAGRFIGTVMPLRKSIVGSAVDGRVLLYPVNEGDRVKKGQPLAQLRTKTLKIELAGAEAEMQLRKQELAELENGTRPGELAQSRARLYAAQALMKYHQARFKRFETLFRKGQTISEEDLDEARSRSVGTEQVVQELEKALALAEEGPRKERIAQAAARLLAQQEQVHYIQDRIAKYTIRAPFDGYIITEYTEVGEWITTGDPVAQVIDLDPVEIRTHVPEQYIGRLRSGMTAVVTLDAMPGQVFSGEVTHIVPQADVRSRTFPVKVQVANPRRGEDHLLKAGMLARVTLAVGQPRQALLVPKDALVLGGPQIAVYVLDASPKKSGQGKVRPVPVQIGISRGNLIQVTGPLKKGQQVVVRGNERLRPGQLVRVNRVFKPGTETSTSKKPSTKK